MSELKRCEACRRNIWGIENTVRVKDREEPVTVCTECRQVLELIGRAEGKKEEAAATDA